MILGTCSCDQSWSSLGDFAIKLGADCDQFIPAIRALGIINAIVQPFGILFASRVIYLRAAKKTKWHEPSMLTALFVLISFVFNFIYGLLKAIDPVEFIVGKSVITTAAASILSNAFNCTNIIYSTVTINFFKGYMFTMPAESKRKVEKLLETITLASRPLYTVSAVALMAPLMILAFPEHVYAFGALFYCVLAFVQLTQQQLILREIIIMSDEIGSYLEHLLEQSEEEQPTSTRELQSVHLKLNALIATIRVQALPVVLGNLFHGFWPYLQRKSVYISLVKAMLSANHLKGVLSLVAPANTFTPLKRLLKRTHSIGQYKIHASDPPSSTDLSATRDSSAIELSGVPVLSIHGTNVLSKNPHIDLIDDENLAGGVLDTAVACTADVPALQEEEDHYGATDLDADTAVALTLKQTST